MAFDPNALLFAVMVVAAAASYGFSLYFLITMIREVNAVDGQPGEIPWWLVFRGNWHLMVRHEEICPGGGSTRALYFALGLAGFAFAASACVLWKG